MIEDSANESCVLVNKQGLHARPSQMLVMTAHKFACHITVRIGDQEADCKSILELMMLASPVGTELTFSAEGSDAKEAVAALCALVVSGFGEKMA